LDRWDIHVPPILSCLRKRASKTSSRKSIFFRNFEALLKKVVGSKQRRANMLISKLVKKGINVISIVTIITLSVFSCISPAIAANLPEGATIQAGQGWVDANGNVMNVGQWTDQMIVDWVSFCIAHGYTVNFSQPGSDSICLNRVTGGSISEIFGNLNANGKIWLLNPNGILFGPSAKINTAGFLASTLHMSNDDFLNRSYIFTKSSDTPGFVINKGQITITDNGYVVLMGAAVKNNGVIQANLGKVILSAGEKIALDLDSEGTISVVIEDPVSLAEAMVDDEGNEITDAVRNSGSILADGGTVVLTASVLGDVFKSAVNNDGTIQARSLINENGEVYLLAEGDNALVSTTGTIDVSAHEAGVDGGYVEVCADRVVIDGNIDVTAVDGANGELFIDPLDLYVIDYYPEVADPDKWKDNYEGDVAYDAGEDLGAIKKAWIEAFVGSLTLRAKQDIKFRIGEEYNGKANWTETTRPDTLTLSGIGDGDFFRLEAGRTIDFGDDFISTGGGNMQFYADYNVSGDGTYHDGDGQIYWSSFYPDWNGGLNSNGGDIILSGADVDLYFYKGSKHYTASVDAGDGTVYLSPSGRDIPNWVYMRKTNEAVDNDRFVISKGLESIKAGRVVIGADPENGITASNIRIQEGYDLTDAGADDCSTLELHGYGAIKDENASGIDLTVENLVLSAELGIGSGDALETAVETLNATNTVANDIEIDNTGDLSAQSVINTAGDVSITTHSNLNVGYIEGINVSLSALDGSIFSSSSDINTLYLKLYAQNDIGAEDSRINTDVDLLSAYSWNKGDIYISEANDIELGIGSADPTLEASIAANDGVVCVESNGDMLVNSVISENGGVFLESSAGSIYTGDGWDPDKPSQSGPNVIARGYSLFSAPNGTIGVDTTPDTYDPLAVSVEIPDANLDGNNSAIPDEVSAERGTPSVGLTILAGDTVAASYADNWPGGSHGQIGISGATAGIVSPGIVLGSYADPVSPSLVIGPATPPGYVFHDDTDGSITDPPATGYIQSIQIWPPPIPAAAEGIAIPANVFALISDPLRYRIPKKHDVDIYQVSYTNGYDSLAGIKGAYFYHPLVEVGMYDMPAFGADMYEFIDNYLDTTNPALMPELEEEKKI